MKMTERNDFEERIVHTSCEIYNKVFSKNIDASVFYYKHFKNPYKIPTPIFNDEINGKTAGVNCFMGAKFIFDNEEIFGAQSCDSAVLPEFRGKGVFSRIIRSAEKQCEMDGIKFLFGFPNDKSYPGFMKLGWSHAADLYRAVLPLDTQGFFKRRYGKTIPRIVGKIGDFLFQQKLIKYSRKDNKIDIKVFDNCPFTETDFKVINRTDGIMIKRSVEYYKWKVDNNPSKSFKYAVARDRGEILGFIIYEILDDCSLDIVDWLCFGSDTEKQKIVLAKIFYELIGKGTSISISLVNETNGEMKMLEGIGFLNASNRIMKQRPLPLIIKTFGTEPDSKLLEAKNWICRSLDTDVIVS